MAELTKVTTIENEILEDKVSRFISIKGQICGLTKLRVVWNIECTNKIC